MRNIVSRSLLLAVGLFAATAAARAQEPQPAAKPHPATPRATTQRAHADERDQNAPQAFSVVLVLGDMQATTTQDNVPAAARKALADMKDFLPYKSYRLLDAQWTLCCGSYPITSRLKGAEEQEYELQLSASLTNPGRVTVRFSLSDAGIESEGSPEARAKLSEIQRRIAQLRGEYDAGGDGSANRQKRQRTSAEIVALQQQASELKRTPARASRSRGIIDTSFRMDVGETVVVGTSRTKGDKALIALLTAVPPKAPAAR
jgi:hypothetical protein